MDDKGLKKALDEGKIVTGMMVSQVRSPAIASLADTAGLDFFIVDMEHGSYSYETVANICLACNNLDISPIVRVPEIRRECLLKPLEAGAEGLLVPRVETKEEAERAVYFSRYAPQGDRGLSTRGAHTRFAKVGSEELASAANENILLMLQIETLKGVQNVDSIMSTCGVDLGFIGPSDLSFSLKNRLENYRESDLDEAVARVINACKCNNAASGIHIYDPEDARKWVESGLQLISINTI